MRSLRGRVVLVTGGSAGIGRATARRLAAAGARVVVCGRDQDRLDATAAEVPGLLTMRCDVTDADDRERLVRTAVERCGRVDALVNNAGRGAVGRLVDLDRATVEDLVAVNFTAVAEMTRLVLPHLPDRGGDVVMMSSVAAWAPLPPLSLYSATKAGVSGLTAALRREVPRGVRVHLLCPAPTSTEWLARDQQGRPDEAEAPGKVSAGAAPERVAAEVERCLTGRRSRTAAVPRWWGVTRLTSVPPLDRALDAVLTPLAPSLVRAVTRYGRRL
ncbi:SDR family oxidoreductase [Saccharothrix sp. MB29]|nr:SDR family oxidoreductase [Saccharothrix sp. MB29]